MSSTEPSPPRGRRSTDAGPRTPPSEAGRERGGRPAREPSVHRLYARASWSTLDGLPLVAPRRALLVESQIIALCRRLDVEPMDVRARADRVDLLFRFKPNHFLADVAGAVKTGSGEHLERKGSPVRWARGLALATVTPEEVRPLLRKMSRLTGPV